MDKHGMAWIETNIVPLLTTTNIMMVLGVIFSLIRQKRNLLVIPHPARN